DELAMDITNPTSAAQPVSLRVDDAPRAGGASFSSYGFRTINPGTTVTFSFPISQRATDPMAYGMKALPRWPGNIHLAAHGIQSLDFSHIAAIELYMQDAPALAIARSSDTTRSAPRHAFRTSSSAAAIRCFEARSMTRGEFQPNRPFAIWMTRRDRPLPAMGRSNPPTRMASGQPETW